MGWTCETWPRPREEFEREHMPTTWTYKGNTVTLTDSHWTPEGRWNVCTITAPDGTILARMISVWRARRQDGCWGEGGFWTEQSGPSERCPRAIWNLVPKPIYDDGPQYATEWRERVGKQFAEADAAAAAAKVVFRPGYEFVAPERWSYGGASIAGQKLRLHSKLKGKKSWYAQRPDGGLIRIPATMMLEVAKALSPV